MSKNVKNTTFPNLLDLIAPHSCRGCGRTGTTLCDRCKKYILLEQQNICPHCKNPNPTGNCQTCKDLPPTFIAGKRTGLLGDLVHDFKYHSIRALAHPLAEIIYHALPEPDHQTIIIPLPTVSKHIRARGLDHTYLIAKHLAKLHPNYHVKNLLLRAHNTVQVGSDRATRLSQASTAYELSPNATIDPTATYILFDDVWTTGASLRAAEQKLRQAGAKHISFAILAVSQLTD